MKEVPGLIEKNRKTVSKLGKKINEEFTYYILKEKVEGKILDIKK